MKERVKLFISNIIFTSLSLFAWISIWAFSNRFLGDFWSRSMIAIGLIFIPVLMSYFIFWKKLDEYETFYEKEYIRKNLKVSKPLVSPTKKDIVNIPHDTVSKKDDVPLVFSVIEEEKPKVTIKKLKPKVKKPKVKKKISKEEEDLFE